MQVSDFLMRTKSRRFPSIEKDMKMVLAHCGSLFLDPAALTEVGGCTGSAVSCLLQVEKHFPHRSLYSARRSVCTPSTVKVVSCMGHYLARTVGDCSLLVVASTVWLGFCARSIMRWWSWRRYMHTPSSVQEHRWRR